MLFINLWLVCSKTPLSKNIDTGFMIRQSFPFQVASPEDWFIIFMVSNAGTHSHKTGILDNKFVVVLVPGSSGNEPSKVYWALPDNVCRCLLKDCLWWGCVVFGQSGSCLCWIVCIDFVLDDRNVKIEWDGLSFWRVVSGGCIAKGGSWSNLFGCDLFMIAVTS